MSAQLRTRPGARRRLAGLLFVPLLVFVAGCASAAVPPTPAAPGTAANGALPAPAGPASGAVGAPDRAPGVPTVGMPPSGGTTVGGGGVAASGGGVASSGSGVASSGTTGVATAPGIAYPYPVYPGSPGLAPDHTIVVSGTGRADVKADLSDRASAQRDAIAAAIADARTQADVVARAAGVTITGVLSVGVSSGNAYAYPMPMPAGAGGSTPGASQGGPTTVAPPPVPSEPTPQQLVVTVTVAYRIS